MILIKLILIFPLILGHSLNDNDQSDGLFKLAVIFSNCTVNELYKNVQVETNIKWIIDRLNSLNTFDDRKITNRIYTACRDRDEHYFEILYEFSKLKNENFLIGVLSDDEPSEKVRRFAELLEINFEKFVSNQNENFSYLIKSSIGLLEKLNWDNNLTLMVPNEKLMEDFFSYSRFKLICVKKSIIYTQSNASYDLNFNESDGNSFVLFGNSNQLTNLLSNNEILKESQLVIVPTDGFVINDLGEKTYIVLPSQLPLFDQKKFRTTPTISRFFETAQPILNHVEFLKTFIKLHCTQNDNGTLIRVPPLSCLKKKLVFSKPNFTGYNKEAIMKILKIEQLKNNFVYDIFKIEKDPHFSNTNLRKMFTFNIFDESLVDLYNSSKNGTFCTKNPDSCSATGFCVNFMRIFERKNGTSPTPPSMILSFEFRTEPWILIFLAVSSIGVLFCFIIFIFILVCIYRKNILEGNPITTILLLLTVLSMYCCVIPFSISFDDDMNHTVCLMKIFGTTFSFCLAFSLILSRSILLATVTNEIAYMSHIPGAVQSFLTLFMMAVQFALNLQIFHGDFCDFYQNISFLYLMSYNCFLLILIICLAPFIYNSKRNYKEGKYFVISVILIVICWCFWISCFKVLNNEWKDVTVCFALVSTATIIQGVLFVSRTYLMTVSSVRNKYRANNLSNFNGNGRNSALDIYRSQERRAYDRVNVATVNTTNTSNLDMTTDLDEDDDGEDIYNYPTLPRDLELNFEVQTNSSTYTDKVTRF